MEGLPSFLDTNTQEQGKRPRRARTGSTMTKGCRRAIGTVGLLIAACCRLPTADASYRTVCKPLTDAAYMDPLVSPGHRSAHEHMIAGSLGFASTTNLKHLRANKTTCDVAGDSSVYWVPTLWRTDLGHPRRMVGSLQAYYTYYSQTASIIRPELMGLGISMKVGDSNGAKPAQMSRINFFCEQRGVKVESPVHDFHPSVTNCKEIRIDYTFPSCWNGMPYAADQSHVAYPVDKMTGECPKTHPKKFVELRLEQRYPLKTPISWKRGHVAPLFFSSDRAHKGEGRTAHADVILLWDVATVKKLIAQCRGPTAKCGYDGVARIDSKTQQLLAAQYKVPKKYLPPPK